MQKAVQLTISPSAAETVMLLRPLRLAERSTDLLGDHPDERDIAAQLHHLVVDRQPLARGQPRYMLEGIVDVVGDALGRAFPPAAQVAIRTCRTALAIERGESLWITEAGMIEPRTDPRIEWPDRM